MKNQSIRAFLARSNQETCLTSALLFPTDSKMHRNDEQVADFEATQCMLYYGLCTFSPP